MLKEDKTPFLIRFAKIYDHPAIVLWRSIEAKNLSEALNKIGSLLMWNVVAVRHSLLQGRFNMCNDVKKLLLQTMQ